MLTRTPDSADKVAETVLRIVAAQAMIPVVAVRLDATPQELGLDSLGLVEMVFAVEEAFDITVPFNANEIGNANETGPQAFDITTIGTVVAAVQGLVAAKNR